MVAMVMDLLLNAWRTRQTCRREASTRPVITPSNRQKAILEILDRICRGYNLRVFLSELSSGSKIDSHEFHSLYTQIFRLSLDGSVPAHQPVTINAPTHQPTIISQTLWSAKNFYLPKDSLAQNGFLKLRNLCRNTFRLFIPTLERIAFSRNASRQIATTKGDVSLSKFQHVHNKGEQRF